MSSIVYTSDVIYGEHFIAQRVTASTKWLFWKTDEHWVINPILQSTYDRMNLSGYVAPDVISCTALMMALEQAIAPTEPVA